MKNEKEIEKKQKVWWTLENEGGYEYSYKTINEIYNDTKNNAEHYIIRKYVFKERVGESDLRKFLNKINDMSFMTLIKERIEIDDYDKKTV
jgi:hypothetical protein